MARFRAPSRRPDDGRRPPSDGSSGTVTEPPPPAPPFSWPGRARRRDEARVPPSARSRHRAPPAATADRGRLDRHDRRRGRDRARDQGVGHQPVPHPVVVDGVDAALCEAGGRAASRGSPTACSRTASSTASPIPSEATSSSSRRRPQAKAKCGAGGTFVKRIVGLPGETVADPAPRRSGLRLHRRPAARGAVHRAGPP